MSDRRKSSYSGGGGSECVAVGTTRSGAYIEDTKQDHLPETQRIRLSLTTEAWQAFTASLK